MALPRVRAGLRFAARWNFLLVVDLLVEGPIGDAGAAAFVVTGFRRVLSFFFAIPFGLLHVRGTRRYVLVCHVCPPQANFQVAYRCDTVRLMNSPAGAAAAIALRDVRVSRGAGGLVLAGLTLEIAAGETVALVGRSGAGKSTILKTINGLIVPDAGSVTVEGRSTREWNPLALR